MKKIYLVTGTTGEFSDRAVWNVKAFSTKKGAKAFVTELEKVILEQLRHHFTGLRDTLSYRQSSTLVDKLRKLDPDVQVDYNGIFYEIEEIELEE